MASGWRYSTRRGTLPPDWSQRRAAVAARAGWRCEAVTEGIRCSMVGTECDHKGDRMDHRISELQWLCRDHHRIKTNASRPPHSDRRGAERHPGLV